MTLGTSLSPCGPLCTCLFSWGGARSGEVLGNLQMIKTRN